jgi:hypothetical protein
MSKFEKFEKSAFAFTVLAVGYSFLPVKADVMLSWIASIGLLVIGFTILIRAYSK